MRETMVGTVKFALATIAALLVLLYSTPSFSQDNDLTAKVVERDRIRQIYRTRPVRLDEPLREENISDEEIREIESVMSEQFPGAIVNIGGVTSGCPCEDSAGCDSQVWVVAHRANRSNGLMLSRIADHWTIGPLQEWWRRYDRLRSLMISALANKAVDRFETYREFQEQLIQLQQEFPTCGTQL
jgi:hypothetical protein